MNRPLFVLLAAAMLSGGIAAQQKDGPDVELQKAIRTETVDGNLKAAIEQYQKLSQSADRSVAAQALVRMGQCYEKLGSAEARKAYERVVNVFADQRDAAGEARRRLAALTAPATGALRSQRVDLPNGPSVHYGHASAITPDGRLLVYRKGRDIVVRDMRAGTDRATVTLADLDSDGDGEPIISPDGRLVAYVVSHEIGPKPVVDVKLEIWVMKADGTDRRRIKALADRDHLDIMCWSADGTRLLMTVCYDNWNEGRIEVVDVSDGTTKTLKDKAWLYAPSPDGRWVCFESDDEKEIKGLYVVPTEGGNAQLLVAGSPLTIHNPVWAADSSRVYYGSRRPDQPFDKNFLCDLFTVRVSGGPERSELVARDVSWPFDMLGVTRDGDIYSRTRETTRVAFEMDIDPNTGVRTSAPRPVPARAKVYGATWSPDGTQLAYWVPDNGPGQVTIADLMIRPANGTGERRVWHGSAGAVNTNLQWFPDGRSILLHRVTGDLTRLDVSTGTETTLLEGAKIASLQSNTWAQSIVLSPDGHSVYYTVFDSAKKSGRVIRRDLAGGGELEICTFAANAVENLAVSPDGSRLAMVLQSGARPTTYRSVSIVPAAGGPPVEISRPKVGGRGICWSADGKHLFLLSKPQEETPVGDVFVMPSGGGEPKPLGAGLHDLNFLRIAADGKKLIVTDQKTEGAVWITRVAPPPPAKK